MRTKTGTEWSEEPCRNCGDPGGGRYCRSCGQRKSEIRVSLRRMLKDVLEDQLSIDATLPRTLVAILFRPGRLTTEYLDGRIVSWVPPFRLYLAASVLFFLSLSIGNRAGELRVMLDGTADTTSAGPPPAPEAGAILDTLRAALGGAGERGAIAAGEEIREAPESRGFLGITVEPAGPGDDRHWTDRLVVQTGIPPLDRLILARVRELGGLPGEEVARRIGAATLERVPTAMFVLLPVFALLLKLLYIRSRRYYVEHFVFALHYHAFAFLGFTLMLALRGTPVPAVAGLWLFLYLWLAMKHVYGQGTLRTTLKWAALVATYELVLAVGLLATALVAVIML